MYFKSKSNPNVTSAAPGSEHHNPSQSPDGQHHQLRLVYLLRLQPPGRHLLVAGRDQAQPARLSGKSGLPATGFCIDAFLQEINIRMTKTVLIRTFEIQ